MTGVVFPVFLRSTCRGPGGRMLTGHAAIRNRQPPRDPTVAVLGQMLLLDALTEQDGASQDVMRHPCDVVRPSRLSSAAMPDGGGGQKRACGFWRCDGR